MKTINLKKKLDREQIPVENGLILFFFLIGIIEVVAEIYFSSTNQYGIKLVQAVLLAVLYWYVSTKRNSLFFINIFFLLIGRLCFIPNDSDILFYALIAVVFHRVIEIYLIAKLLKIKDFIPSALASIPFMTFFFYLVSIPEDVVIKSYAVLIIQVVLISILSGIVLSQFLSTFNKKHVWLIVFGLMSLTQTFIVLIEKFYFQGLMLTALRPISLVLNTIVCFSFYRFVIDAERLNND